MAGFPTRSLAFRLSPSALFCRSDMLKWRKEAVIDQEQNGVSIQTFGETFYLNHFRACVDDFITLRYLEESDFDISVVWSLQKFLDLISQLTKQNTQKTLQVIKAVLDHFGHLFAQCWTVRMACWPRVLGQLNKTITCSFRTVRVSAAAGAESPM